MTTSLTAFANLGRLLRTADLAESITDPEVLSDLQNLLEPEAGRIDRIYGVTLDGNTLTGKGEQRISLGRSQTLLFTVSDSGEISYRLINADEAAQFADSDEGWAAITEFAAAKGKGSRAGKKLNCKPGNVQCGGKCQAGGKRCNVDPTPDQKAAASAVVKKAKTAKPTSKAKGSDATAAAKEDTPTAQPKSSGLVDRNEAKSRYRLLGEGVEGEVYLDDGKPPRAVKYTNATITEDVMNNVQRAGDLGIAPRLLERGSDNKSFAMEFLEGYSVGIHPDTDGPATAKDLEPYDRAFLRTLKRAHDNGIIPGDLHEENVMVNATTQETRFIDQGYLRTATPESRASQLLDRYSSRPLAAETVERMLSQGKTRQEFRRIQRQFDNRDTQPLSDEDYNRLSDRLYELLKVD